MAIAVELKEKTKHYDLYRELEFINVLPRKKSASNNEQKPFYHFTKWVRIFSKQNLYRTQAQVFQASMKLLVICGQSVGLLPFVGVLENDVDKVRYNRRSIRFVYSCAMCLAQTVALALSLFLLLRDSISVTKLGYFSFYSSTCLTCVVFLRLASKWEHLVIQISTADLNEFIDPSVKFKCICATVLILITGVVEHALSIISTISDISDCYPPERGHYRLYVEQSFPWLFDLGVTYNIFLGIALPVLFNLVSAIIWSYSHLFIVCVSYFLSSILEQINKKIKSHEGQYLPSSYWRDLREDYSSATRLVRAFDDVINNIVFASFASNLFFVCLRLYHILVFGFKSSRNEAIVISENCQFFPTGIFAGHETLVYLSFSLAFVVLRSLAVSLVAARVHAASLVPAHSLYRVPSPAYCTEVERFIEQVHGDIVALSGLNFFYVTKELVLSVAGTIVTYELVLLQFNG